MLVGGSGVDVDGAGADGSEGRRVAVVLCRDSQRLLQRDGEGCRSMELGCTESTQGTTSQ